MASRQGPEACGQALRGLWRGAVAVCTDQDLAPVGPHARGARLLGHDRSPWLDGLAGAAVARCTRSGPPRACGALMVAWAPALSMDARAPRGACGDVGGSGHAEASRTCPAVAHAVAVRGQGLLEHGRHGPEADVITQTQSG